MDLSSEQAPTHSHRIWWKLHWFTWVLVLLVGGSLVFENWTKEVIYFVSSSEGWVKFLFHTGWPIVFRVYAHDHHEFFPLFSALNILLIVLILLATAFTAECYFRHQSKWQFSIQGIMAFTTFVALLLANGKYDLVRWRGDKLWLGSNVNWEYIPFFFIAMGLWCVFWTAWRLIGLGVGRMGGGSSDG